MNGVIGGRASQALRAHRINVVPVGLARAWVVDLGPRRFTSRPLKTLLDKHFDALDAKPSRVTSYRRLANLRIIPTLGERGVQRLTPNDLRALYRQLGEKLALHVREDRLCALCRTLAATGARRGEVLALTWADLSSAGGLSIRATGTRHHDETDGWQWSIGLLARGVPVAAVAARLGHSVTTCERTYRHYIPSTDAAAAAMTAAVMNR